MIKNYRLLLQFAASVPGLLAAGSFANVRASVLHSQKIKKPPAAAGL